MKVTAAPPAPKLFQPITITVVIETENEARALRAFTGAISNATIDATARASRHPAPPISHDGVRALTSPLYVALSEHLGDGKA